MSSIKKLCNILFLLVFGHFNCGDSKALTGEQCNKNPILQTIVADWQSIEEIKIDTFDGCLNVKELYLHNNLMKQLPAFAFRQMKNLEKLVLSDNNISFIHPLAFVGLEKLEWLHLGGNRLTVFNPEVVKPLKNLYVLHLEGNKLSDLNVNTLLEYIPLLEIRLYNNSFENKCLSKILVKLINAGVEFDESCKCKCPERNKSQET